MANILVFNYCVPDPVRLNGNTLRVFHLSRELAGRHRCFLAAFGREDEVSQRLKASGVYEEVVILPPPAGRRSWSRHLYVLTGVQARIALPWEHRRIVRALERLVDEWRIDFVITHTGGLTEYVEPLTGLPKVMDSIDCNTLAGERKWRREKAMLGPTALLKSRLALERKRYLERRLTDVFDLVTVVSPVDRDYLRGLCPRGRERIIDIPNGVSPAVFEKRGEQTEEVPGGIAFWGGLDFPPNTTAVHYFYDEVFLPFHADQKIVWYIIGKNPSRKMEEMAERHRNIRLTGYVEDLCGLVSSIPLMVNPMRMGGGLKNKVLEAFALERVVVSNALGMEAIPSARANTHYVHSETPQEFAEAIISYSADVEARRCIGSAAKALVQENYTWEKVGDRYLELIEGLLHGRLGRQVGIHGS